MQVPPKTPRCVAALLAHFLVLFIWTSPLRAADQKIYVEDARIAESVDADSKECAGKWIDASSNSKFAAHTVVLWTKLAGDRAAYEKLSEEKKLPIKHVWKFQGSLDPEKVQTDTDQESLGNSDDTATRGLKPINVGTVRSLAGLLTELLSKGFFDWRTWSHRFNLGSGKYTVEVRYADDSPVTDGKHTNVFTVRYVKTR